RLGFVRVRPSARARLVCFFFLDLTAPPARYTLSLHDALPILALIPMAANGRDASRRHGADATMARDFSRALLNSVPPGGILFTRSEEHTSELQSRENLVCRLLLEKKKHR